VFIVTDSDESFKRMAAEVPAAASGAGSAPLQVLQLPLMHGMHSAP
jgi:hypothetical protein